MFLGIQWCHEIWILLYSKLWFSWEQKVLLKQKTFFLVSQVLSFKPKNKPLQMYPTQPLIKGNKHFLFFCNLKKSGALWVCTLFLHIIRKILFTETFHWLELIIVILSLVKGLTLKNAFTCFFLIFQKIGKKNQSPKVATWKYSAFPSKKINSNPVFWRK